MKLRTTSLCAALLLLVSLAGCMSTPPPAVTPTPTPHVTATEHVPPTIAPATPTVPSVGAVEKRAKAARYHADSNGQVDRDGDLLTTDEQGVGTVLRRATSKAGHAISDMVRVH